ncbi:MAG TPA: Wzz/FepE/Etk N-terminal domain-containing protein [Solirubrobacteraceae bacterium]|nr:Wzz/FepE/Etk N-terminal domain-containing protein [Solirubrobacteraceae bacterium]
MPLVFDSYEVDLARPPLDERDDISAAYGLETRGGRRRPREQPPSVIGSALSRYKWWILLAAVVLAVAGAAYGVVRKPVYNASSTLNVGKVNPNSPGFYGYAQSASDLATTYSRAITATAVLNHVKKTTGIPADTAAGRLTAEPIPNSSLFRIVATGPSSTSAVALANQAANGVVSFEAGYNYNGDAAAALKSFQQAARANVQAQARVRHLGGGSGANSNPALQAAQVAANTAQMRANALSNTYQQALEAQPASNLVSLLTSAVSATSDKTKKLELFAAIGLLAGLVIGTLVAVLREQRRMRLALEW